MKRVVPDDYHAFACLADRCRHSCCIGWEVDVDAQALERYRKVAGAFGERLRQSIAEEETPHFILGEGERCPFLNEQNLCEIYIELGEDALCQICTDHPRWRNWFADRVEEGLGLCCEEAARQLLERETPLAFTEELCEGETLEADEDYLQLLKQRNILLNVLQDRSKPLKTRICEAFSLCGIDEAEFGTFDEDLAFLSTLEIMDGQWLSWLSQVKEPVWNEEWDRDGEHLLCYLMFRYYLCWGLERWAEDFPLRFGAFSLRLLGALYGGCDKLNLERRVEFVRAWSAELEYSEDNLNAVADYLL